LLFTWGMACEWRITEVAAAAGVSVASIGLILQFWELVIVETHKGAGTRC